MASSLAIESPTIVLEEAKNVSYLHGTTVCRR
jgi:hypothetical protein